MAIKFDELLEALDSSLDRFDEDLDSMWIIIPTERRYDELTSSDYFDFARKYGTFNSRQDCIDKIIELAPDRWDAFIPMKLEGDSSLNEALNRYTFGQDFENHIPHNMRYKEYDFVKDNGQDILYWVTQEPFDDSDIEDFQYALSNETDFDGALVILRDDSSYIYDQDKNSGRGVFVENTYAGDFEESLNEALKDTRVKSYDTQFGTFIIKTREGKSRRTNYMTGKKEWMPVKSTLGYFEDFPLAVEFFLYRDGQDRYVSSSQGRRSDEWVEFLNARDYDDALHITEREVVKCFQDYYGDSSIY